ncbi:MAG: 5-formyltetrahydrofolate cyclo-ligase [Thermoprotei archaeon]|nr:MAG: 5-formyltetrahydrofolate cyclo-ligase [Thermoprotei archaeon]
MLRSREEVKREKQVIRERIWRILEDRGVARFPRPVYGRIPNFEGAERAAGRLFLTKTWTSARVVKINPDSPQKPIRYRALKEEKIVIMPTPKLVHGFLILDPRIIPERKYGFAATIRGAFLYGRRVKLVEIPTIDLVVTGSVAVDLSGGRIGKGGGYSELEYAILREVGAIEKDVYVATTIHDLQLVDKVPLEEHDLKIDIIATPSRLHFIKPRPLKPPGILWEILDSDKKKLSVVKELLEIKKKSR